MNDLLTAWGALSTDQVTLATLNGNVATATTALANANAAVAAQNIQIGTDTTAVVTILQAAPYNGSAVVVPTTTPITSVTLLTVTATTPPGLSAQSIPVAA